MDAERKLRNDKLSLDWRARVGVLAAEDIEDLAWHAASLECALDAAEARAESWHRDFKAQCEYTKEIKAERDRLREALERLEWGEERVNGQTLRVCYSCGANLIGGTPKHDPDCIIGRALNRPECREVGDAD